MADDRSFILRFDAPGPGRPVAIKDLIDMQGLPTTAGSQAVAESEVPAFADAACLAGIRAAEAAGEVRITGKTNLHELAFGITGINRWSGTPVNPLDNRRVPGGSSSGSAVAVATGEADLALGTDTGGSIRIPAACCGIAGLKTTIGRIDVAGIRPLAPTLDTVGPMARTVEDLLWGMQLLEPGFDLAGAEPPDTVGRLRVPCPPEIDTAIDRLLAEAGFRTAPVYLPGWSQASADTMLVIAFEAFETDGHLLATGRVGRDVAERLEGGSRVTPDERRRLVGTRAAWMRALDDVFDATPLFALPVLSDYAPLLTESEQMYRIRQTHPINLAGIPALALPVPTGGPLPASLQLVGPAGSEELLLAAGLRLQAAAGT